jgi:hypothetical protein
MLLGTKGCEFSPIPTGILPYLLQTLANALTKWSKVSGITELLQYPLIALVAGQPSRPMSPIMGDIERLIAGRDSNGTIAGRGGNRVGIIDTTEQLRRLLRVKGNGKKNQ